LDLASIVLIAGRIHVRVGFGYYTLFVAAFWGMRGGGRLLRSLIIFTGSRLFEFDSRFARSILPVRRAV
jgi:hypothetical protein